MKHARLSAIFLAVSSASLLVASSAGFAAHKHHKVHHKVAHVEADSNLKGEANFKAEVPVVACPPVRMLMDGFYVGVGLGYDSYRIRISEDEIDSIGGIITGSSINSIDLSATGWMGTLFLGYGRYFDQFYLGAELGASMSNARGGASIEVLNSLDVVTDSANFSIKARSSYSIAPVIGVKLSDSTLFYGKIGYISTDFRGHISDFIGSVTPAIESDLSRHKRRGGVIYGVGIETYLAENVSLRGEYTHTSYSSLSLADTFEVGTTTVITTDDHVSFKPSNNEYVLSVLYHFA